MVRFLRHILLTLSILLLIAAIILGVRSWHVCDEISFGCAWPVRWGVGLTTARGGLRCSVGLPGRPAVQSEQTARRPYVTFDWSVNRTALWYPKATAEGGWFGYAYYE